MDAVVPKEAEARIDPRFVYRGARRQHVAFPLGGIGTGSVSLTGSGRLIDWSIRNRPAIHQHNGYSHFAIKAERDGRLVEIMPKRHFRTFDLSMVHPGNRHISRPVRVFKEFAVQMAPTLFPSLPT